MLRIPVLVSAPPTVLQSGIVPLPVGKYKFVCASDSAWEIIDSTGNAAVNISDGSIFEIKSTASDKVQLRRLTVGIDPSTIYAEKVI